MLGHDFPTDLKFEKVVNGVMVDPFDNFVILIKANKKCKTEFTIFQIDEATYC
jgi:hypothetical protein